MNKLSITIKPQANVLDGITLYERVDKSTLMKVCNSTLLKTTFNNKFARKIYQNEKQQLDRYASLIDDKGRIPITYNRNANNKYGRSNPPHALGLYPIRREIRHTLAGDSHVDLDVKNAHPDMLLQVCQNNDIPCSHLNKYVKNRQDYFDEGVKAYGCNEESVKILFICYTYGSGFKNWFAEHGDITKCDPSYIHNGNPIELHSFKSFRESMGLIHSIIAEKNPDICETVERIKKEAGKTDYNLKGSVCSFFLQEYEVRVLEQMFLHCINKNLIKDGNAVLCADGMMIDKTLYYPKLLDEFNVIIMEKIGFNLTFTEKKMNQGYNKILDKHLNFNLYSTAILSGSWADHFAVMFPNKFLCVDGTLYNYNGVFWTTMDSKKSALHNFIDTKFYKYMVGYCLTQITAQNALLTDNMDETQKKSISLTIKSITALLDTTQGLRNIINRQKLVDDIVNKLTNNNIVFDSNPFLYAFNNKIYDLKTSSFIEPNHKQYIRTTCGYDYSDYYAIDKTDTLKRLITSIFPDPLVKEYYMTALSTGLYGELVELLFIATGTGGNGKSLINALMMDTVGGYGYKLSANVLLDDIKEGANPAVASLNRKRFVLAQEPNSRRKLCTATVKVVTGDASINARMNYSNDCITILNLTMVMECNNLPPLDEITGGVVRRFRGIPFESQFIPADTFNLMADTTGFEVANPYFKTNEFKADHRQAMFEILIEYWNGYKSNNMSLPTVPNKCKEIINEYFISSDDFYTWFIENYELGDATTDFIYVTDIHTKVISSTFYYNLHKNNQKEYRSRDFAKKIEQSIFLKNNHKLRNQRFNGLKLTKNAIIGYRTIPYTTTTNDHISDIDTEITIAYP
jgi:phage/plasmid-associated DNA primase